MMSIFCVFIQQQSQCIWATPAWLAQYLLIFSQLCNKIPLNSIRFLNFVLTATNAYLIVMNSLEYHHLSLRLYLSPLVSFPSSPSVSTSSTRLEILAKFIEITFLLASFSTSSPIFFTYATKRSLYSSSSGSDRSMLCNLMLIMIMDRACAEASELGAFDSQTLVRGRPHSLQTSSKLRSSAFHSFCSSSQDWSEGFSFSWETLWKQVIYAAIFLSLRQLMEKYSSGSTILQYSMARLKQGSKSQSPSWKVKGGGPDCSLASVLRADLDLKAGLLRQFCTFSRLKTLSAVPSTIWKILSRMFLIFRSLSSWVSLSSSIISLCFRSASSSCLSRAAVLLRELRQKSRLLVIISSRLAGSIILKRQSA